MDDAEKNLYFLMEIAEQQQQAVKAALAALDARQTALVKTTAQLQTVMQAMLPAAEAAAKKGAADAVKTALENASQTATDAVAESCKPLLAGLAGVERQAAAIEGKLAGVAKWFGWRFAATACGAILMVMAAAWAATWWQRAQLADVKAERDRVSGEVAAAQSTLAELEKRTGGVHYEESKEGRFMVTRKGYEGWTCEGLPCIRLK